MATVSFTPGEDGRPVLALIRPNDCGWLGDRPARAGDPPGADTIHFGLGAPLSLWGRFGSGLSLRNADGDTLAARPIGNAEGLLSLTRSAPGSEGLLWEVPLCEQLLVQLYLAALGCEPPAEGPGRPSLCANLGSTWDRCKPDFAQAELYHRAPGLTTFGFRRSPPDIGKVYVLLCHDGSAGECWVHTTTDPFLVVHNKTVLPRAEVLALVRELLGRALRPGPLEP